MGLFSNLFSKKEKREKAEETDEKKFESSYGTFWYSESPAYNEYGYECEIDWDGRDIPSVVFIETDSLASKDARLCYERFVRIYSDKDRFDYNVKNHIAEFIMSHPDLFRDVTDRDTIIGYMSLVWLGVRRNGDIECSMDGCLNAVHINLLLREDGTKEIEYDDDDDMSHKKFSL